MARDALEQMKRDIAAERYAPKPKRYVNPRRDYEAEIAEERLQATVRAMQLELSDLGDDDLDTPEVISQRRTELGRYEAAMDALDESEGT